MPFSAENDPVFILAIRHLNSLSHLTRIKMPSHNIDFKTPIKEIPMAELMKTSHAPEHAGGFGDVWKCIWSTSSSNPPTTVAIKVVRVNPHMVTSLKMATRDIRREACVWAKLKHDHILSLHGITTGFGILPAFVSSWMTKGSLDSYLKQQPWLSTLQKLDMIASGLKYLHEKDIVHNDLTPNNILIDSDDKLCLADFGLSMILPQSGSFMFYSCHAGNARWMAPEMVDVWQAKPTKPADVYSHGCIMLQLLCGQQPYFWVLNAFHVMAAILRGRKPFRELTGIDEDQKQYWLECLSTDFNARPKVQEIVAFLEAEIRKFDDE
ncbi:kinase-like domain-containing protein [Suillus bovinus]|uniref:kinase-like domain-containing protein n=1 Tax=Suillus bovinus TaxID=48563 RepID=UPI001B878D48|nr:kinase-like domain-containing protein [Suillus bovinus]KAG2158602.1 kinase-like domain-containing protein [Suillus bovinus]